MRYSRMGIIIALVGAEIFIAGAIVAALGGHSAWAIAASAHRASFTPKSFDPIDAGPAPRVEIEDADADVTVLPSTDGRVHVTDNSRVGGGVFSRQAPPQLQFDRTADGVRIYRPSNGGWFTIGGWSDWKISVAVPAGASLVISNCGGADVSGLAGPVSVRSEDGDIAAGDLRGDADISSEDGHIEVRNMQANHLTVSSSDGDLELRDVTVATLSGTTSDGAIKGSGLQVGGGSLQSSDGSIELALLDGNLSVHAHTDDGTVTFDGRKADSNDDDSSTGDFHLGSGGGSLQVATEDGSIHITTNGAQ